MTAPRLLLSLLAALLMASPVFADGPAGFSREQIQSDLAQIDAKVSAGFYENGTPVVGQTLKARDIYRTYLRKAADLSAELVTVRGRLNLSNQSVNLQQLGAMTRSLSAKNAQFHDSFKYGEDKFQTYQLIEKAVLNLEDAVRYWQMTNRYRWLYRGTAKERDEDDAVLQIKLQTAINAIDDLRLIMDTRQALEKDLKEDN